jgi:hypothetical protein
MWIARHKIAFRLCVRLAFNGLGLVATSGATMRKKQKLELTADECSIIKGLIDHTDLNDQMIAAIFSHLSRTINHREIGYFRSKTNEKYRHIVATSKIEVEKFIARYQRFERIAKAYGFAPQEAHFQLVQKGAEAMKTAVGIFNNPQVRWKSEIYIVNAVIAWTYLFHAYYMSKGIDYRYIKEGQPLLTEDGRPKHWELSRCLTVNECPLPAPTKLNLQYLIMVRNEIEHRMSDHVDRYLEPKLQACAINFETTLVAWFGPQCSIAEDLAFAIQLAEISIRTHEQNVGTKQLPAVIATANKAIEAAMSDSDYNDPRYSYRVYIAPRVVNNRNKADQAVVFAATGSEIEMAIREVERPKYTASHIVEAMRKDGYTGFTLYGKGGFVEFWKKLDGKSPGKGYGVQIAGIWYWYETMMSAVRAHLKG